MVLLDGNKPAPIESVLSSLRPRLEATLASFGIPKEDAEALLEDTLGGFLLKRHFLSSPECWIVSSLKDRCFNYWRGRPPVAFTPSVFEINASEARSSLASILDFGDSLRKIDG